MSTSEAIMNIIYRPGHAETNDRQYQKAKKLYLTLSDKLNSSVKDDPAKKAALSVIAQLLFSKRNAVSINKSSATYCTKQARSLPLRAGKFFPEIQAVLKNLDVECGLGEFDNAIIGKIDVFTQALYSRHDRKYFELKDFFFKLENCSTPLDLFFRGLFYARAKRNIGKVGKVILAITVALIAVLVFLRAK